MGRRICNGLAAGLGGLGVAVLASCMSGGDPAPGGPSEAGIVVSARWRYPAGAGARTVLEREPNNYPAASQFVGEPGVGQRYVILGTLQATGSSADTDAYRFTPVERVEATWSITSDDPRAGCELDAAVGVVDFRTFTCGLEDTQEVFSECYDSALDGGTGSLVTDGTFLIVVASRAGTGAYVLEVVLEAAHPGDVAGASHPVPVPPKDRSAYPSRAWHRHPAGEATGWKPVRQDVPGSVAGARAYDVPSPSTREVVPGQTLARFAASMSPAQIADVVSRHGMRILERSPGGVYRLAWDAGDTSKASDAGERARQSATALGHALGVVYAEPAWLVRASIVPNDERYAQQRYPELIHLPQAWDTSTGDDDVIVAVLDSGVVYSHPDLGLRLLPGYDFVSDPDEALDGDGRDDDASDPGDGAGTGEASTFHGTHVAGTVGAVANNGVGVCGVTWAGRIMPVRVLGRRASGDAFDVAEAIRYAAGLENVSGTRPRRRADVINLSFDSGLNAVLPQTLEEAVREAEHAGAVVVAAAGNQGSPEPSYPAAFEEVISVGAVDWSLERAWYSNHGPTLDLMAPGGMSESATVEEFEGILSTLASDESDPLQLGYGYRFGTSMSCPQVAGVAALMLSVNPRLSPGQVRDILRRTAIDLGVAGCDDEYGCGLLDAAAAVEAAWSTTGDRVPYQAASVSPLVLDFGTDETVLTISVQRAAEDGSDPIRVSALERTGRGWLSAGPADVLAGNGLSEVDVRVDRTGLAPGVYRGEVTVTLSDWPVAVIDVAAAVGHSLGPGGPIFVVGVDPDTGEVLARATTTDPQRPEFSLVLPRGRPALLIVGTDRDGDTLICEAEDACGAWPSLLDPQPVTEEVVETIETRGVLLLEPPREREWGSARAPIRLDD